MDDYYQNGPLPTWIGWYLQHLPHWFHAATAFGTLALELVLVFMLFLPRRWRIACFFIVTPWQLGVILTANYTFLNYLVLALGICLVDDRFLRHVTPQRWRHIWNVEPSASVTATEIVATRPETEVKPTPEDPDVESAQALPSTPEPQRPAALHHFINFQLALTCVMFAWLFYSSSALLLWMLWPTAPLPSSPVMALEPFRIADRYGLFARMTRGRYEIEFQGSNDGQNWTTYRSFATSRKTPAKRPVSTRHISRASTGTCGSRR